MELIQNFRVPEFPQVGYRAGAGFFLTAYFSASKTSIKRIDKVENLEQRRLHVRLINYPNKYFFEF
jgi:hypothetical protein